MANRMFTKLRNKFLVLNMSMISLVMTGAFAIIYVITDNNIQLEIQKKLSSRSEMQLAIKEAEAPADTERKRSRVVITRNIALDDSLSFTIEVDENGKILQINSSLDIPEEVYYTAAATAWSNLKDYSTITLAVKQWRYTIAPIKKRIRIMGENDQQITVAENSYQILFLDVTEYDKTLLQLLTTLLAVGFIMLFVIFIISLYFANRAIKPIAEAWEKQKQFIADASHELKTPLSIINANYDALLANQEETVKSQVKWLDYIRIGADRMTKLVNDLLTLAKVEDVNLETQKMPFNMSHVINDVILSMEAGMMEKNIQLSRSIEPDIIVKSDLEKIKQVVMILFDNAVKYTNENGQIDITLIKSKRQAIYSIKNSGKGIAKQDLPKVFDRFYRADPSRTHESGSFGLGLSIAKTIIDKLGGEIRVTSVENKSTTFSFTLSL